VSDSLQRAVQVGGLSVVFRFCQILIGCVREKKVSNPVLLTELVWMELAWFP